MSRVLPEKDTVNKRTLLVTQWFFIASQNIPQSIKNIFFPFLPEDSGSAIFILSLLSVVDSMLGIKDGTRETRKQNQQVRVKDILNDSITP